MEDNFKISVLGAGKMGQALIKGLLDAKVVGQGQIVATVRHEDRTDHLSKKYGVKVSTSNAEAVNFADVVVVSVKPQNVAGLLDEIKDSFGTSKLLISVVASITTDFLENQLGKRARIVRTMPNTPCLIRQGMTAISGGASASQADLDLTKTIFDQVGRTLVVDEKHMDAVTGLSASGPAFTYVIIESMAEGGVKAGLPRGTATELAAQAVLGGASMVLETGEHPALLKDAVTTPAGCTIDGLMEMEEGGIRVTMIKTIVRATEKASHLVEAD